MVNTVPFGGTIVNVNHVVTSCRIAFTTDNLLRPLAQFVVRAGSVTFLEGVTSQVTAVFPHPECNLWTFDNDVAVLRVGFSF